MMSPSPSTSAASASVFRETPLSPAEIANNLRDELKRLRKRKQIAPATTGESASLFHEDLLSFADKPVVYKSSDSKSPFINKPGKIYYWGFRLNFLLS